MGWKLSAALAGAVVLGIVLFRNQIKGALSNAGQALGEGVGGAFGGFLGGLPSGFLGGGAAAVGKETKDLFAPGHEGEAGFFRGLAGFPSPFELFQPAYGDDGQSLYGDPTITPENREYSDVVAVRSKTLNQTFII